MRLKQPALVVIGILCAAVAVPTAAQQADVNLSDTVAAAGGSARAPGDVIETFANTWAANAIGMAFDPVDGARMVYFHEAEPNPGIWFVDTAAGHAATALTYTKLGGQNTNGGTVDPTTGDIYATDYNGDQSTIDDNVYRFQPDGTTVAYWEVGDDLGGGCSGGALDSIVDIARHPSIAGRLYATTAFDDTTIFELDLSDTSGGAASASPCTLVSSFQPAVLTGVISEVMGIEYDPGVDGYWISDFDSTNIVLVDSTFSTMLTSFSGGTGTYNTGISPQLDGTDPVPVWVTDYTSNQTTILEGRAADAPTPGIPALGPSGIGVLALLLAAVAILVIRRRMS